MSFKNGKNGEQECARENLTVTLVGEESKDRKVFLGKNNT